MVSVAVLSATARLHEHPTEGSEGRNETQKVGMRLHHG